jgi:copper(I)-binding protein
MTHINIGAVLGLILFLLWSTPGHSHDFRLGPLRIDHPYATPTPAGATTGAVYFRGIRNTGKTDDQLISATTPVAASVELHRSQINAQQVMRMREVPAINLPAGQQVLLRHGGEYHLMLIGLKEPLVLGQRFPITLRFAKAGEREVIVWVQQPRVAADHEHHKH